MGSNLPPAILAATDDLSELPRQPRGAPRDEAAYRPVRPDPFQAYQPQYADERPPRGPPQQQGYPDERPPRGPPQQQQGYPDDRRGPRDRMPYPNDRPRDPNGRWQQRGFDQQQGYPDVPHDNALAAMFPPQQQPQQPRVPFLQNWFGNRGAQPPQQPNYPQQQAKPPQQYPFMQPPKQQQLQQQPPFPGQQKMQTPYNPFQQQPKPNNNPFMNLFQPKAPQPLLPPYMQQQNVKQPDYLKRQPPAPNPFLNNPQQSPLANLRTELAFDSANKRLVFKSLHERVNVLMYTSVRINKTLLSMTDIMIECMKRLDPRTVAKELDDIIELLRSISGKDTTVTTKVVERVQAQNADFLKKMQTQHKKSLADIEKELATVFKTTQLNYTENLANKAL